MEPATARCSGAEELPEVLPATQFPDGTRIMHLALDPSHLYFGIGSSLYRVARQGGRPEKLFSHAASVPPPFAIRDDQLVILAEGALLKVPKAGGAATTVAALPQLPASDRLSGRAAWVFDQVEAYVAGREGAGGAALHAVNLLDGSTRVLGFAREAPPALVRAGQSIHWTEGAQNPASPYTTVLMSLPAAGGDAREVPLDLGRLRLDFSVVSGTAQSLFLDARLNLEEDNTDVSALSAAGIYRLPPSGGRAEQLLEQPAFDALGLFGLPAPSQVIVAGEQIFILGGSRQRAEVHSLANSAAAPEARFCVIPGDAEIVSIAAEPNAVYLALALGSDAFILRRDL